MRKHSIGLTSNPTHTWVHVRIISVYRPATKQVSSIALGRAVAPRLDDVQQAQRQTWHAVGEKPENALFQVRTARLSVLVCHPEEQQFVTNWLWNNAYLRQLSEVESTKNSSCSVLHGSANLDSLGQGLPALSLRDVQGVSRFSQNCSWDLRLSLKARVAKYFGCQEIGREREL